MKCLVASDERVAALGDRYEGEGCGCDCHDFHATPHVQSVVAHADKPWFRCECSCGWRGMWLRDKEKVLHCPRTELGAAERDVAAGTGGSASLRKNKGET